MHTLLDSPYRLQKALWKAAVLCAMLLLLLSPNVANAQQNTYYATEELNVRSGPGMGYSIIGSLDEGESVTLLRLSGKWARISYQGGREGYAFFAYLSPRTGQGARLYATTDLNVRKGPGMSYSIIGSLDEGEAVTKIRSVGNWALVLHQGKQVYVFEKYLSLAYSAPAADPLPMQFATLIDPLSLYEDAAGTTLLTHLKYYGGNQRVVILEDLGDMKKIAVYGYTVYAKAEDLTNYSDTYSAQRDARALYNYNLTTTGESYRETYKNNPYYGGFGYDSSDNTCVLFFKQGHMPSISLEEGFKLAPCAFSLAELAQGEERVHALAKRFGWKEGRDYTVELQFREDYHLPLNRQRNVLTITVLDQLLTTYSRFEQAVAGSLDAGMYTIRLALA